MLRSMQEYRRRFGAAADGYDGSTERAAELVATMADYSAFVTDDRNAALLTALERERPAAVAELVSELRTRSARCAAVMEKYRALDLLAGRTEPSGYFTNVEACIDEEFGALAPTSTSTVLLVGSGSFPMTLLNIAERTGAATAGVDVDVESVELARRVVELLGPGLGITLDHVPAEAAPVTRGATHIVFSSTVAAKYDLLHRMHPVTRDDVVVAMRFGDGLKSLFNYPMQDVDPQRWRLVETICRPDQVFDVAVYAKQRPARGEGQG